MTKKVNYLNNRDILHEIHRSKCSFSAFAAAEYDTFDVIVKSKEEINPEVIESAKATRAKRLSQECDEVINPEDINVQDIIFRVMTFDHIPAEPHRKRNPRRESDKYQRLNFPPFQHWKYNDAGELICVGKSHWKGDLENGYFCQTHGKISDKLAKMYLTLCARYANRGNVRGYTYNDEMQASAALQLVQVGLQFDESLSDNPFSYLTTVVTNTYLRVMNIEKKMQSIRDDILEMNGLNPSNTRIHGAEYAVEYARNVTDYDGDN